MGSKSSGVTNQIISLPNGGGALKGIGEKFPPDLHIRIDNFPVTIAPLSSYNCFQPYFNFTSNMRHYNIIIKKRSDKEASRDFKPLSKLQLIKYVAIALFLISAVIALILIMFVIGFLLALPFVVLGVLWIIYMALRGKVVIRRRKF